MKSILFSFIAIGVLLASCGRRNVKGHGEMISEERVVGEFSQIDISAPVAAHVLVQPGAKLSVRLSGYKNLLEEINTDVEANKLTINSRDFINFNTDKDIVAEIVVSSLSELEIHGTSDVEISGSISGEELTLKVSGAGNVTAGKVDVVHLNVTVSGVGDVKIDSGVADKIEYKVSGAGNISSFGVQGNDVKAKVSGTGDIEVYALKSLEAKVSGAGSIIYKGNPVVKSETSGIGEVVAAK